MLDYSWIIVGLIILHFAKFLRTLMLSKHKLTFKSPVSQHSKPSLCKLLPFYGRKTSIYRPSPEPGRSRIKSLTHQNIVKKTPSLFGVAYRKEIKKAKI